MLGKLLWCECGGILSQGAVKGVALRIHKAQFAVALESAADGKAAFLGRSPEFAAGKPGVDKGLSLCLLDGFKVGYTRNGQINLALKGLR